MNSHTALLLPLAFVFGCGGSTPDAAVPPTGSSEPPAAVPSTDAKVAPAVTMATASAAPTAEAPRAPGAKPAAAASPDAPIASGLSQAEIAKAVEAQQKVFDPCYKALGKKSASVKIKATVGPAGQVNAVDLVMSNSKNAKADACVIEAFKKIKFPPPHGNSTATITFPMDFGALEQVQ